MGARTAFPRAVLERLPDLRLLVTTGPVNAAIDVSAAARSGRPGSPRWSRPRSWSNTSRGPIVDQAALVDALRARQSHGAGLDVHDVEPLPPNSSLRGLPRTVLTRHLGYVTDQTYRVVWRDVVADVAVWPAGEPVRVLMPRAAARRDRPGREGVARRRHRRDVPAETSAGPYPVGVDARPDRRGSTVGSAAEVRGGGWGVVIGERWRGTAQPSGREAWTRESPSAPTTPSATRPSRSTATTAITVASMVAVAVTFAAGALTDRVGRRPVYLAGWIAVVLFGFPVYPLTNTDDPALVVLVFIVGTGLIHAVLTGTPGSLPTEQFRTSTRTSGASTGHQLAASLGHLAPLLAGLLVGAFGWPGASVPQVAAGVIGLIGILVTRETWSPARPGPAERAAVAERVRQEDAAG